VPLVRMIPVTAVFAMAEVFPAISRKVVQMSGFEIGDLVVLTAGSMRMAVEETDGKMVSCVWCHEGKIGRDRFAAALLKKWEHRENDRSDKGRPQAKGEREGGPRRHDDKPRGKPGWDGKPREKKYFRKD